MLKFGFKSLFFKDLASEMPSFESNRPLFSGGGIIPISAYTTRCGIISLDKKVTFRHTLASRKQFPIYKSGICGFMNIESHYGAVDSNLFFFFNPFVLAISYQDAVDGLPRGRSNRFYIVTQGRFLDPFISNTDTTKTTIKDRVEKMESQHYLIERVFQEGKIQVGLGDYQAGGWRSWHHHMARRLAQQKSFVGYKNATEVERRRLTPLIKNSAKKNAAAHMRI